jgi:methionyl-tRNA synthetase
LQGEKVRLLKSSSKEKSVWQPEVTKLLDLKKQLAEAEKSAAAAPPPKPQQEGSEDVASLEAAVAAQGEKLRKLKSETKDKAIIQPEVTALLQLKEKLKVAQEKEASTPKAVEQPAGSASVADLEAAITAQVNFLLVHIE